MPVSVTHMQVEVRADAARAEEHAGWIVAAQAGDALAFERLVAAYEQPVLRLARNLVRRPEDIGDLYQEIFTKVYTHLHQFRFECSFYTWIYRVGTNTCLDYLRRQKVRRGIWAQFVGRGDDHDTAAEPEVSDVRAGANPERQLLNEELRGQLQRALGTLPARERMVFELRHYQGLRLRAIGEILQTSEATAKNALFRATRKLREELGDLLTIHEPDGGEVL